MTGLPGLEILFLNWRSAADGVRSTLTPTSSLGGPGEPTASDDRSIVTSASLLCCEEWRNGCVDAECLSCGNVRHVVNAEGVHGVSEGL